MSNSKKTTLTNGDMVKQFHHSFGLTVNTTPTHIEQGELDLGYELICEEMEELYNDLYTFHSSKINHVQVADALGDIVYTCYGLATRLGIPLDDVFKEIHRSNMTKLDKAGLPLYNKNGKVIKSNKFEPPLIADVLKKWS